MKVYRTSHLNLQSNGLNRPARSPSTLSPCHSLLIIRMPILKLKDTETEVRFQVLTATSMEVALFLDVATCSLVPIDRRFGGAQGDYRPHDGGSKRL
jgi:hypothetical protein